MRFEIYHQLGFRENWNIQSILEDNTGDGVIISPRSMDQAKVEKLDNNIKEKAIFDPQLMNALAVRKKMATYDFYPCEIMPGGFETEQYPGYSSICASNCVSFQDQNDFRCFVIPTRYSGELPPVFRYTEILNDHYITPFLTAIDNSGSRKEIFVELILNSHMIKDVTYSSELLNWITGIEGITGIYLITELDSRNKQINDGNYLYHLLNFINALSQNELKVILGYLNTEAILLSLANPSIVTIGSFENTRIYNSKNFVNQEERTIKRPPTPRLYIPKLLDWIEHPYVELMNTKCPSYIQSVAQNEYLDLVLDPKYGWHFNKPEPYMHFFIEGSKQLRNISSLESEDRYCEICNIITSAIDEYSKLRESGFELGVFGSYLSGWLTVANLFGNDQGWSR
ncbi:hypothetical protein [Methanofollis fontis]|uniref:hypothetical protein n=1 Tax=Methanofollis fontis TaxID=2052832 RepID=UPI00102F1F94|nr:hypothetical protein [Methanofollis fontis]